MAQLLHPVCVKRLKNGKPGYRRIKRESWFCGKALDFHSGHIQLKLFQDTEYPEIFRRFPQSLHSNFTVLYQHH